jgi:HrpA-like RNA helicase
MSATMAATLYQQYFGVPQPPIHVGARRFPIKEFYIEDLMTKFSLPASDVKAASSIMKDCEKTRCKAPPNNSHMDNLFKLSARMTMCVGCPGSSILIFVPGMNEIISITEQIERLYVPGIRFTCYPIHSDVPFEEQMMAFDSPSADEVKVVIATNAAESSVTLPDVDHVICLGLCKQIVYNASSHRQMLMPAWISRASAIQRAGRTGRVRKGNVYRLYTRAAFEDCMDLFETGEMLRVPLDSVILTLKEMLQEEATPVLLQCLEPPDLSTIQRSFQSLCHSNFLSSPDDTGHITTLGKFVSALGIDLALGSLIGLGIQFGVGAEAVEMAAILSFPKTPWVMTSPLWHDPPEFNG